MRHAPPSGGPIKINVRAAGSWIVFLVALLSLGLDGRFACAESCTVTIQVFGADQKPIPRAEASLFWQVKDGVMTSVSDESAVSDGSGKLALRFDDRNTNRPVLIFSPNRELGGILGVSKADNGKERNVTLGPTVRAHGRLFCAELNFKPQWVNTMVTPEGFDSRIADHMGNSAQFDFLLPPGKYSFNSYGSDVSRHSYPVTLETGHPDLDLGTIDLKPTAIARLKGKPAPTWDVTAVRGIKRTAQLADYKGKWIYLEFWGFW